MQVGESGFDVTLIYCTSKVGSLNTTFDAFPGERITAIAQRHHSFHDFLFIASLDVLIKDHTMNKKILYFKYLCLPRCMHAISPSPLLMLWHPLNNKLSMLEKRYTYLIGLSDIGKTPIAYDNAPN